MKIYLQLIAASSLFACSLASAYDAAEDFSVSSNPNGVWEYGYSRSGDYGFISFDSPVSNPSQSIWFSSTYLSGGTPQAWTNTGTSTLYGVAPGQLSLQPGRVDPTSYTVLRFVAPISGSYSYYVQFYAGDLGQLGGLAFVNEDVANPLASFTDMTGSPATGGSIILSAGDRFDVAVVSNQSYSFDGNTPVDFFIDADNIPLIPEPPPIQLLAIGLVFVLVARRHRLIAA